MVRVFGSSGDSHGFHRGSDEDATKIKLKPGIEALAEGVSPQTLLSEAGFTQSQNAARSSDDAKEEGSEMDLEEKPPPLPQGLSGSPADGDICRDPPGEARMAQDERTLATKIPSASRDAAKRKKPKSARKQLNAPDSDTEDRGDQQWTNEDLTQTFYKKGLFSFLLDDPVMKILSPMLIGELQGITSGAFNASELFDLKTSVIQRSARIMVSQYASATSEAESDSSADLQRMTLAATEQQAVDEVIGTATEPMVDRHQYEPPIKIQSGRQEHRKEMIVQSAPAKESNTAQETTGEESGGFQPEEESHTNTTEPKGETWRDREQLRSMERRGTQAEPKEESDDDMNDAVSGSATLSTGSTTIPREAVNAPQWTGVGKDHHYLHLALVVKAYGVGIRLSIDYEVVNSLTILMVYHMWLINDLIEDLDKTLWLVSAFITPFGLFEWTMMPFGLKNALRSINESNSLERENAIVYYTTTGAATRDRNNLLCVSVVFRKVKMAKGDKSAIPATPKKSGGMRSEVSGLPRSSYSTPTTSRMTPITERFVSFDDSVDYSDAKEDEDDDYLVEKTPVSELSEGAVVSIGHSTGVRALARNLAEELEEVASPTMVSDDDGSDGAKPSVATGKTTSQSTDFRPLINGDTPGANKVIGKTLELMMTKSSCMQMIGPTLARQAVWMDLGGEWVVPIDSTSACQVSQDTVMLLRAMGSTQVLRAAFGVEEIAPGRQVVARQAFMPADPSQVPLPQTPIKQNESSTGVFGSKESPYMHDSHMVTPRSASRQDRVVKESEVSRQTSNTYKGPAQQSDRRYDMNEDSSDDGKDLWDVDHLEGDL
ncbi:hypothetical protein PHMEG_00015957, partial [Phytophthora megakarya]